MKNLIRLTLVFGIVLSGLTTLFAQDENTDAKPQTRMTSKAGASAIKLSDAKKEPTPLSEATSAKDIRAKEIESAEAAKISDAEKAKKAAQKIKEKADREINEIQRIIEDNSARFYMPQDYCLTEKRAKEIAEIIYTKREPFASTVVNSHDRYLLWKNDQLTHVRDSVVYGQWYISTALGGNASLSAGNPAAAISALDPTENPFNPEEVYDGAYVWHKIDVNYGAINDYSFANKRLIGSGTSFLYCELKAFEDIKLACTVSAFTTMTLYLNGEKLAHEANGGAMTNPKIVELPLKKGKNVLVIKTVPQNTKKVPTFYFEPFASPSVYLGKMLEADYSHFYKLIGRLEARPSARFAAFISDENYKRELDPILDKTMKYVTLSRKRADDLFNRVIADKVADTSADWMYFYAIICNLIWSDEVFVYDPQSVIDGIEHLMSLNPDYPRSYIRDAKVWKERMPEIRNLYFNEKADEVLPQINEFKEFARKALLTNPYLQATNKWLFIKRDPQAPLQGLPQNWQGNHALKKNIKPNQRWNDELWVMTINGAKIDEKFLFKPEGTKGILDLEIDWDATKIMYSSLTPKNNFQLFEIDIEGNGQRMLTPEIYDDVDNFDGVYLPDNRVIFCSTATFVGVPCVSGTDYVANLFVMDQNAGDPVAVDKTIRQLTFEQDADWMPTVMDNGRIMYTRWEYTDNSHYFSRILMQMNPDGTAQSSYYGSTSYWPNSLFYVRQIPDQPNKFVGIVSGHHGTRRGGEMHLFDVSKGTVEAEGEYHNFLSRGRKFEPEIKDQLVDDVRPHFLHPYPLSENYVVASMKDLNDEWGIYLVDTFGNATLLTKTRYLMSLEPMPIMKRPRPAPIADKTDPDMDKGYVFLSDIYQGPGLKDVARGTVRALRVFEYYYCYREMGSHDAISQEGAWDVKRILGTVEVESDGSAMFEVPANRPIAIQPLDEEGKAIALMRSWFVVRPGEVQSCVGCHEGQGMTPPTGTAIAARKKPSEIKPFRGPVRGYSFERDVQPILDKYCLGCHKGQSGRPNFAANQPLGFRNFPQSYLNLHPYVRRTGPESNQNLLSPMEFHANTSELVQLLEKGHKGVKMDKEDYDHLITWIDLNVPARGTWTEYKPIPFDGHKLRMETLAKYANRHDDQEEITYKMPPQDFIKPEPAPKHPQEEPKIEEFPFGPETAVAMVKELEPLAKEVDIKLSDTQYLRLHLVPAGTYVRGSNSGFYDEGPAKIQRVEKPFYIGEFEVTNAQYATFDPKHNSGYQDRQWKDHVNQGYPANEPNQSVVRVSYYEALRFCEWISQRCQVKVDLPTEVQWEWAARAGTSTPFYFGGVNDDFSKYANLADYTTREFAVFGVDPQPLPKPIEFVSYLPAEHRYTDSALVHVPGGNYAANAFELYDMIGNVAEWTRDNYTKTVGGEVVLDKMAVRGGSWRDRPKWATVSSRKAYHPWQKVYNVGFRVVIEDVNQAVKLQRSVPKQPVPTFEKKPILKDTLDDSNDRRKIVRPQLATGNLVRNGDFEEPKFNREVSQDSRSVVTGWQSNIEFIERWAKGALDSPELNSQGKPTGAHLEIASSGNSPFNVFQEIEIPAGVVNKAAEFSFEAWARIMSNSRVQVSINGRIVLDEALKGDKEKWTKNTYQLPKLNSGDKVKINFIEIGNGVSWHVDDVSLTLKD